MSGRSIDQYVTSFICAKASLAFTLGGKINLETFIYYVLFNYTKFCKLTKKKMRNSSLKVKGYEADEIKKLLNSDRAYITGVRLNIVHKISLGYSSRKLSEVHGVSFKQITNWVHRFEKEGIEGLKDKKGRGRKALLRDIQLDQLKKIILTEFPENYGYEAQKWIGPIISDWIKKIFGIEYKEAQVYNLLAKISVSFVKGKGFLEKYSCNYYICF